MPAFVKTRLGAMMFLEYVVWGSWYVTITTYLTSTLHFSGTQAGAWYFAQKMVPARATLDKSWYVYEWTDQDGNQMPGDADTFKLVATSP